MRRERRRTVAMIVRQQRGGGWPQYRSTSCVRADVDERGGGRAGRRGTTIGTGNGWTAGIQDGCGRKGPARTRQRVRGWGRFRRSAARASPRQGQQAARQGTVPPPRFRRRCCRRQGSWMDGWPRVDRAAGTGPGILPYGRLTTVRLEENNIIIRV